MVSSPCSGRRCYRCFGKYYQTPPESSQCRDDYACGVDHEYTRMGLHLVGAGLPRADRFDLCHSSRSRKTIAPSRPTPDPLDEGTILLDYGVSGNTAVAKSHDQLTPELILDHPSSADFLSDAIGTHRELPSAGVTKPRRGRSRTRKSTKITGESELRSFSATWIRVGPGKFVRANSETQSSEGNQAEETTTSTHRPIDMPLEVSPALAATAEAQTVQHMNAPVEASLGDSATVVVAPTDRGLTSTTEVHGITPSAFGSVAIVARSVEELASSVSDVSAVHETEPAPVANFSDHASRGGNKSDQPGSQRSRLSNYDRRTSGGIACMIPRRNRPYLRRNADRSRYLRTAVWSSYSSNVQRRQVAYHAFGRLPHVQRTLRPRSPPFW